MISTSALRVSGSADCVMEASEARLTGSGGAAEASSSLSEEGGVAEERKRLTSPTIVEGSSCLLRKPVSVVGVDGSRR